MAFSLQEIFKKISNLSSKVEAKTNKAPYVAQVTLDSDSEKKGELIDEAYLEKLEEELIKSDLGVALSLDFIKLLRVDLKKNQKIGVQELPQRLKAFLLFPFVNYLSKDLFKLNVNEQGLSIFLIVGVNGVGKTTSIAKLAHRFIKQGKKVLIAAGDTFRAAAEEQLKVLAAKVGADFIELEYGADISKKKSSALVYKAIEKAKKESMDILIIDTAGRLHNKTNLMQELSKIKQVVDKNTQAGTLAETMLVLDASTGQNALSQAKAFMEVCNVSSIILAKYDGTAKAGMIFAIAHSLKLPVKFVGVGEQIEDLEVFDPDKFLFKYLKQ